MSLKYKVGDLIAAAKTDDIDIIAHGCNCLNTMKSGIAPLIAGAFPAAARADQATKKGDRKKLGRCTYGYEDSHRVMVFNLYSQYHYNGRRQGRRDLDYDALRSSLKMMVAMIHSHCRILDMNARELRIGLPKIGAGLAGGDWGIIEPIIFEELKGFDVTIFVLKEEEIPCL